VGHQFEKISGRVIEAAIAVHKELGPGFIESVYELAMCVELELRGVPFRRQCEYEVFYREVSVGKHRVDLVVGEELVVELKAVAGIDDIFLAKTRSYLKVAKLYVGLVINFNSPTLAVKRVVL
jgi:GxxExxY protein